jgi:hypothetical protein
MEILYIMYTSRASKKVKLLMSAYATLEFFDADKSFCLFAALTVISDSYIRTGMDTQTAT